MMSTGIETPPETLRRTAESLSAGDSLAAIRSDHSRLMQLRWLSVAAMTVMALLVFPLLAPDHPVAPMLAVALLLAAANLGLIAGAARWLRGRSAALLQLALDLLGWGAFLYFGGGVTNPAISLLMPLVAVGAAILPARQAWLLAALAVGEYSLLWQVHHPVRLTDSAMAMHWHLSGMWLSFAVSALTVVWFVVRLNAALSRREQALAAINAARARDAYVVGLGKLAAGAAHRLGTPLGTMHILTDELARRPGLDCAVREDLALMREQIDHCREILTQLTREAGHQRAEGGGAVTAATWVEGAVARWRSLRPHATAELDCSAAATGTQIVVDASLTEALHNLIDNAANANTSAGQPERAVDVDAGVQGGDFVVEVRDRGLGMPGAGRADGGRTSPGRQPAGMGVGLLLAYSAVEDLGGRLDLQPRPGGGTIARLAIPVQEIGR